MIVYRHPGDGIPLAVFAASADGTGRLIIRSPDIKYTAHPPGLVTISKDGTVTCPEHPRHTMGIVVEYGGMQALVLVKPPRPAR